MAGPPAQVTQGLRGIPAVVVAAGLAAVSVVWTWIWGALPPVD